MTWMSPCGLPLQLLHPGRKPLDLRGQLANQPVRLSQPDRQLSGWQSGQLLRRREHRAQLAMITIPASRSTTRPGVSPATHRHGRSRSLIMPASRYVPACRDLAARQAVSGRGKETSCTTASGKPPATRADHEIMSWWHTGGCAIRSSGNSR